MHVAGPSPDFCCLWGSLLLNAVSHVIHIFHLNFRQPPFLLPSTYRY